MSDHEEHFEKRAPEPEGEIDAYTARMNKMVDGLKKRSQTEHANQIKMMLVWSAIGFAVVFAAIYLMLNMNFNKFSDSFIFLQH